MISGFPIAVSYPNTNIDGGEREHLAVVHMTEFQRNYLITSPMECSSSKGELINIRYLRYEVIL
jgi:hypothetical protein